MFKVLRSVALATLVMAAGTGVVSAVETVNVTSVTFDSTAVLCGGEKTNDCAIIHGEITCDATGPAELVSVVLTQRGTRATDNLDLLDFPCTTTPTEFTVVVESFGDLLRRGRATVIASVEGTVIATEKIQIRASN
jgi:hypothetical protein